MFSLFFLFLRSAKAVAAPRHTTVKASKHSRTGGSMTTKSNNYPGNEQDVSKSAYATAAEIDGTDPRCIPIKLDGPVPEGDEIVYPAYTARDHETWNILFERQAQLLPGRACREYLDGMSILNLSAERIPALNAISAKLQATVGWGIARIPGLLDTADFLGFLARAMFPSTDYIREPHEIEYTPAPDCFHDIFGHLPMLTNPFFTNFYQFFSQTYLRVTNEPDKRRLERFYWFTVEFGLINTAEGRRIYGAGILSSPEEVVHALTEKVEVVPFSPERLGEQEYEVWHLQPVLFAIESFEQLDKEFREWAGRKKW
jgi:phenylalanine-4-hydroxylase